MAVCKKDNAKLDDGLEKVAPSKIYGCWFGYSIHMHQHMSKSRGTVPSPREQKKEVVVSVANALSLMDSFNFNPIQTLGIKDQRKWKIIEASHRCQTCETWTTWSKWKSWLGLHQSSEIATVSSLPQRYRSFCLRSPKRICCKLHLPKVIHVHLSLCHE